MGLRLPSSIKSYIGSPAWKEPSADWRDELIQSNNKGSQAEPPVDVSLSISSEVLAERARCAELAREYDRYRMSGHGEAIAKMIEDPASTPAH